jgi:sterol 3beta-glucosyltransferase
MENPEQMTQTILDAVQTSGVRAIVSESWSKLDSGLNDSKDVLFIGDCPHAM